MPNGWPLCRLVALVCAILAVRCGGGERILPASPSGASPNAAPVITSVTVTRTEIEGGDTVDLTATAQDGETPPDQLGYLWAVDPPGGTFMGAGQSVQWRAPLDGPVPTDYLLTVTVVEAYVGREGVSGRPTYLEHRVTASSPPVAVNDAFREMKQLGERFLADLSNSSVSPEVCVRNLTDSCDRKRHVLEDINRNRLDYTIISARYQFKEFVRSRSGPECTARSGAASCALVIYAVEWIWVRKSDGARELVRGENDLKGVYERSRWRLCDSLFYRTAP